MDEHNHIVLNWLFVIGKRKVGKAGNLMRDRKKKNEIDVYSESRYKVFSFEPFIHPVRFDYHLLGE